MRQKDKDHHTIRRQVVLMYGQMIWFSAAAIADFSGSHLHLFIFIVKEDGKFIYAVFNTSPNSISDSAICIFNMDHIMESFEANYLEKNSLIL